MFRGNRKFTCLPLLAAATAAMSSAAVAADAPVFPKAPPPPVVTPWTGFYVGAHAGYGWGNKKFVDNFPTYDGEIDADIRVRGGFFGFQGGYNYKINWLVLGAEADFTWSDIKNSNFSCFSFGDQVCSAKPEWFATLAGRIGVTNGSTLLYLKGGAAWTRDHFTDLATSAGSRGGVPALPGDPFFANETRFGWLVGAGIEYLFARNWSVKLEYNYLDFGTWSASFTDGGTGFFTEEIHQKINLVKVGFNYHFDWAAATAAPVRARSYASVETSKTEENSSSRVLAFSGFDVSKHSYGGLAGALIAPNKDLDTSGIRFFLLGESGTYKYPTDTGSIRGTYTSGDLLAGYAFEGDNYSINLLAGVNAANHMLSEIDPENRVQGTAFGVKVRGDAWVNPTAKTLTYGEAEYSTAFRTYFTKAKFGYDITKDRQIFVGPEVAALGDERSHQWRVGAHVTQMKFGKIQVDVSAGYARDSIVGASAYTNIEFSMNF